MAWLMFVNNISMLDTLC